MPERTPIDESFPLSATNPYGRTKLMIAWVIYGIKLFGMSNGSSPIWPDSWAPIGLK
ncbi:hypothetical protein ACW7EJ_10165 [Acinetobacter soli]